LIKGTINVDAVNVDVVNVDVVNIDVVNVDAVNVDVVNVNVVNVDVTSAENIPILLLIVDPVRVDVFMRTFDNELRVTIDDVAIVDRTVNIDVSIEELFTVEKDPFIPIRLDMVIDETRTAFVGTKSPPVEVVNT
jgi:hypothetical protein